ncbi:helix-turn-helix domain-containing protein [Paenibacillus hemerocallicola]|uniref:Helix-turn-helix domain-containing protein n=1 Tax=Paenibacillus hemerocallicola TaxID=1172614 RepID=A0A5C4T749_9BACL|nr:helix-turn-helix domain-containing protein [Paenibacillus hemerocallicola]TNJ64099.1 helix-turn-helix domain-containing protein [Paenibacillus hemerocallicola]
MGIFRYRSTKRTVLVLVALLFLVVSVISFLSYRVTTNRLKFELNDTHMALLGQIEHKIELMLQIIDNETIQMLGTDEIKTFFDPVTNETAGRENDYRLSMSLNRIINGGEYVFSIDLYSYVRKRLFSNNMLLDSGIPDDYQWIRQFELYEGYSNWLSTRKLSMNGSSFPIYRNVVTLVRTYPLVHSPGYRRGAIAVNIKEEALHGLLNDSGHKGLGETFIVDGRGTIVSHVDKNRLGRDISESPVVSGLLNGSGEGHFRAEADGQQSTVFYVTSAYTGWKIVNVVPEIQLNKPLINIRNVLIVVAALLFVAAALLAALVGYWTLTPFNRFAASMTSKLGGHPRYFEAAVKQGNEFAYFETVVQHILSDSEQLQKQIKETKPIMKWRLMTEILTQYPPHNRDIQQYMDLVGVQLHPNHFIVMSAEFDNKTEIGSSRDLHLYAYALCNAAEELINAESKGAAIEWSDGQCAIIISFGDEDASMHTVRAVAAADVLKKFAEQYFRRTITIGIGGEVHAMRDIHLSHKQSMEALKYKLVMGNNTIIPADDIQDYRAGEFHRLFAQTDNMIDSIKQSDEDKLRQQVWSWFEAMASTGVPPDIIKQLVVQLFMKAAGVAGEIDVSQEELIPAQSLQETLEQRESLEQIRDFTMHMLAGLIERIRLKRSSKEKNEAIEKITRFIRDNYMHGDLSLNMLSDQFRMSVSHLSKMFKDYTGGNFIDYLMEIRIQKSKELLAGGTGKIRDIAEAVGYANVNSFTRIFKKMTGLTPSEYRELEWAKRGERDESS